MNLYEYQKLSTISNISDLRRLLSNWENTYGPVPEEVLHLAWHWEAKIWCRILGIEKLHWLRNRVLLIMHPKNPLRNTVVHQLCQKNPTRLKRKDTDRTWEMSAYFTQEEKDKVFPFLFWIFQELQTALTR